MIIASSEMLRLRRQARRLLVIAYWIFVVSFIGTLTLVSRDQDPVLVNREFMWFWWTLIVFPMSLRSIVALSRRRNNLQTLLKPARRDGEFGPRPLDERELDLHYRMHAKAYYLLQILVPVGVLLLTPPEIFRKAWLVSARVPLLWLLSIVITSLPQTMILWTERDTVPDE